MRKCENEKEPVSRQTPSKHITNNLYEAKIELL